MRRKKIKIVVADNHEIVRFGLRSLLEGNPTYEIIGEASDGMQALRLVRKHKPQIIIADLTLPFMDDVSFFGSLKDIHPSIAIVVFTDKEEGMTIGHSFDAGAIAYVLKKSGVETLMEALDSAIRGYKFVSPLVSQRIIESFVRQMERRGKDVGQKDSVARLSKREREIIRYVARGMTNRQIADALYISPYTVHNHRISLMKKLNVHNTADLVTIALQNDLLDETQP